MQYFETLETPIGTLTLFGSNSYLQEVHFGKVKHNKIKALKGGPVHEAKVQLVEYFEGKRKTFKLKLFTQGTDFQKKTWKQLENIPFGKLKSYGALAKSMGNPKASRAVGGANNKNPIPVIIPCHRVIGASGELVGFAPGLKLKKWLLEHEGHDLQKNKSNFR